MKCPKCGYLGFETTDRCRNCQYDFSLAPFQPESELTLQSTASRVESSWDFDLPELTGQGDSPSAQELDLDRLFGVAESIGAKQLSTPAPAVALAPTPEPLTTPEPARAEPMAPAADDALPFEDAPIVPPPAKPPVSVRRSTPELPRHRPRTTRPVRNEPLQLEAEPPSERESAIDIVASLTETPHLSARVSAALIDSGLLVVIYLAVLFLTLRITGLQNTFDDVRVLPPVPFAGFLALLAFGYVAAFTVAGGQTIGKMIMNLRVIGDDGRPLDAAGGMLRAVGCMLVPITLGLSYVPALVTSDHRALHDRMAGTRVVRE